MDGPQVQAEGGVAHAAVPSDWHVESVSDFNGDGNSDVLWRQDGTGQVYVWEMNGQQVQAEGAVAHAPVTNDWHVLSVRDFIVCRRTDLPLRLEPFSPLYAWSMDVRQGQVGSAVVHAPVTAE